MKDKIISGLRNACYTSFFMKDGDYTQIKPEYLLTVLVAKEIADKNNDFIIKIEESLSNFTNSCIPQVNKDWKFSQVQNRQRTKERIDIAVYHAKSQTNFLTINKALCPIELKGINPAPQLILNDITRNIKYFLVSDEITGGSILESAYFACIEMATRYLPKENAETYKIQIKQKYESYFDGNFHKMLNGYGLNQEIAVEELMSNLYSKTDTVDHLEGDSEGEFMNDWHYYAGVIIEIKKRNK